MTSVAAKHAKGKKLKDVIFVTAGQAQADAKENGRENVVNGTLGAIHDEEGNLVFLKTVKEEYLSLSDSEHVGYAPIAGIPDFCVLLKKTVLVISAQKDIFVALLPQVALVAFII